MKTQVRRWVLVAATLIAAASFGCSKDGGGAGGASAKGALGMLPGNTDVVFGVDFASIRSSALYKQYAPLLLKQAGSKLAEIKADCGFDPLETLGSVTVGIKGAKGEDATFVVTGFKKDALIDCMKKTAAKEGKGEVKVDGDYVVTSGAKGGDMGILFVGDTFIGRKTATGTASKDELIALSKQSTDKSIAGSKIFMDAFAKTDSKAGIWFVASGASDMAKSSPYPFTVASGSLKIGDGLSGEVNAKMNNEADAKTVADMAKTQLDGVKQYGLIEDASADASGTDVHIKASMSQKQLEQLAGMAKGMLGGLGRGGGGGDDMGGP